jgi:hypothetical protein
MGAPSAINNSMQMIVGGTPSTNTITTGSINSAVFRASTNVGEIAIFDENGVRLTEALAATASKFVIAVSRGADLPPLQTDVIVKSTVSNVKRLVYQPATEQSVAVGYNGTSGAINDIASYAGELYTDRIIFSMFMSGADDERIKRGDFQSLLTSTQADVALGIVGSLIRNFNREVSNSAGDKPIVFKAICNEALAAAYDFDETVTVVKGSKQVSVATDIDYNGGTDVVIGDFVRFGATATSAVTLSSPVYKIVGINGLVLTLDRPVTSASGDYVTGSSYSQVITAAQGAAADWGYVKTGTVLDYRVGKSKYKKVRWEGQLNESFGSTPVTVLASPFEGNGTITKIQELENFLNGFSGEQYRMGQPYLFDSTDNVLASTAVAGGGYDIISFDHEHVLSGFTHTVSKKQVIIALPATTPEYALTGTSADDLTDVLEVLAGLGASDLLLT